MVNLYSSKVRWKVETASREIVHIGFYYASNVARTRRDERPICWKYITSPFHIRVLYRKWPVINLLYSGRYSSRAPRYYVKLH